MQGTQITYYSHDDKTPEKFVTPDTKANTISQIERAKNEGWKSRCVFRLDGSIDIVLRKGKHLIMGTFTPDE